VSNQSIVVRSAFIPRPGYFFLDPDYSQIEFKLSAAIAGEKRVLDGFNKGFDYYTIVYNGMFNTNFTGKTDPQTGKKDIPATERKLGKEAALGQQYGQEAIGLARKLKVHKDKGQELMDRYWAGLPMTKLARENALKMALRIGGVQTWFGRKRPLPDLYSDIRKIQGKAVRSVWSTIIQGTAADWLKIAMVRLDRALEGYDAHILLTVHDELLLEVSEKEPVWVINLERSALSLASFDACLYILRSISFLLIKGIPFQTLTTHFLIRTINGIILIASTQIDSTVLKNLISIQYKV